MLTICPCRGCEMRNIGCHGRCDSYSEWRDEYAKMKAQMVAELYDPLGEEKKKRTEKALRYQRRAGYNGN